MSAVTKKAHVLPNPVPLGTSGVVTLPLERYLALAGQEPDTKSSLLLNDEDRVAYIARRISQVLDHPLTTASAAGLARAVFAHFPEIDIALLFAQKALETLRDGEPHNRTLVAPDETRVCVLFAAWNGTHRELQTSRYGNYLKPLLVTARRLIEQGVQLGGLLQIDAYVRDNPDVKSPAKALDEVFKIDIEYSYIPGYLVGCINKAANSLPNVAMLNPDLLTVEESQAIEKAMAR
jgi:hypothetical protein